MITTWKCSEDPKDITHDLTGQVSQDSTLLQLCRWGNGRVGAIVPVSGSLMLYFSEVLADSSRGCPQLDFKPAYGKERDAQDLDSHIVSCGGIVARWLLDSRGLHPDSHGFAMLNDPNFRANILHTLKENPYFDTLYETHFEAAREEARRIFESLQNERRKKLGAWKPENKEFKFSLEEHLKEERRMSQYDERHLYPFFRQDDIKFMRAIVQDYQEYIQYLIKTSSTDLPTPSTEQEEKNPKEKKPKEEKLFVPTQDTFKIENTTMKSLQEVFQLCIDNKWLDELTRLEDWQKLFAGVPSPVLMVWNIEKSAALRDLFWMMDREKDAEKKSFLESRRDYLRVVSSHFVSEKPSKDNPHPYITDFGGRNNQKEFEQPIEFCRRILAWPKDKEIDINTIIFEMTEEYEKKKMIDQAQPDVKIDKNNAAMQDGQRTPRETIRQTKIDK